MKRRGLKWVYVFGISAGLIIAFYFWGRSANLSEESYSIIDNYKEAVTTVDSDTLHLVSYNIGYLSGMTNNLPVDRNLDLFSQNLDQCSKLLRDENVDVACLQEIDFDAHRSFNMDQLAVLAQNGHYAYAARAINWDKKYVPFPYGWPNHHFGKMISGQAAISRFPMVEQQRVVLEKPASNPFYYNAFYLDRLAQVVKIKIKDHILVLINVHFEAWDKTTREHQAKTVNELFLRYSKRFPTIIAGDFNATPHYASNPYAEENTLELLMNGTALQPAIPKATYLNDESSYFTYSSAEPTLKIDHIFYDTTQIRSIKAEVLHQAGQISDHLPVSFRFILK